MSKLLANQIANYNDNGPVEAKEGITVPSGKPFQIAGAPGNAGDYLKSTGSTIEWTTFPSIPAAQVNSDWNATSGVAQITNKPTLAAVATSGSYNDLSNKPSIPSAQIQSDWNASNTSAVDFIKNKPTLFSGAYADLTGKPSIPSNLSDLANVSAASPANNDVLKWNGSSWINSASGAGGSTTFVGLSDTPNDFVSQAGKWLKVNAGATALEYVNAPYDSTYTQLSMADGSNVKLRLTSSQAVHDDILITAGANITLANVTANGFTISGNPNTTYSQTALASGSNVNLRLQGSDSSNDDILVTAGTNISISAVTAAGFTINSTAPSGATVTTDDTAPSSPSDGDLWWKSDEGRLKVYYADGSSDQWVDAFPLQVPSTLTAGNTSISITDTGSNGTIAFNTEGTDRWKITSGGHIIPYTNAAFDIGNAEYKVRHLFLSDNTVYFQGDFLKVAQHNSGGSAQSASYLIPLAKLKDALNASADYEAFKTAILAITDA